MVDMSLCIYSRYMGVEPVTTLHVADVFPSMSNRLDVVPNVTQKIMDFMRNCRSRKILRQRREDERSQGGIASESEIFSEIQN